jgi:hypothetical protein
MTGCTQVWHDDLILAYKGRSSTLEESMFGRPYYRRYVTAQEFSEMPIRDRLTLFAQMNSAKVDETNASNRARLAKMKYKADKAELQLRLKLHSRELRVRTIEAYFRTGIAGILVGVLAVALFVGILKGIPAIELAEYVSPISGLAGIAIGYFFGRAADKGDGKASEDVGAQESGRQPPEA